MKSLELAFLSATLAAVSVPGQERLLLIPGVGPESGFGLQVVGVGDFDRDGTPDIGVCSSTRVFLCSGRTGFGVPLPLGCRPGSPIVPLGDVTGDGVPDIAVTGAGTVHVYAPYVGVSHSLQGATGVATLAGDHDRDGANDIFAAMASGVGLFSGRTGALIRSYPVALANGERVLAGVGDVTGDGIGDFASVESASREIQIHSGTSGSGRAFPIPCLGAVPDLYPLGDIDGDGVKELAFAYCTSRLSILSIPRMLVLFDVDTRGVGPVNGAASAGDLDADGCDDFIILLADAHQLTRVYSGRTRSLMYELSGDSIRSGAGVGDVNGDLLPDFALGQASYNNGLGAVFVYGPVRGSFREFGSACQGSAGFPRLTASVGPRVGERFELRISGVTPFGATFLFLGASNTAWNGLALPRDLAAVGMPTCQLHVSGEVTDGMFNSFGTGTWSTVMPFDRGLLRAKFFVQGFPLDAGANPLGLAATNAAEATIGG